MGPKKITRSVCIFGAPCELTDNGQLYTNQDILAAMQMEINKTLLFPPDMQPKCWNL